MFFLASVAVRVVMAYALTYSLKVSRQDHSWKKNPVTDLSRLDWLYPVLEDSEHDQKFRVGYWTPKTCPSLFRLLAPRWTGFPHKRRNCAPAHPPLAQSHFASGWEGLTPSSKTRTGWDLVPLRPSPDLIFFRLRLGGTHPVLEDSDGVGFETIRY